MFPIEDETWFTSCGYYLDPILELDSTGQAGEWLQLGSENIRILIGPFELNCDGQFAKENITDSDHL